VCASGRGRGLSANGYGGKGACRRFELKYLSWCVDNVKVGVAGHSRPCKLLLL